VVVVVELVVVVVFFWGDHRDMNHRTVIICLVVAVLAVIVVGMVIRHLRRHHREYDETYVRWLYHWRGSKKFDCLSCTLPQVQDWEKQKGLWRMKKKRIIFTGLARDLQGIIGINLDRLIHLGQCFADFRIIIYENDSRDQTREILQEYQRQWPQHVVILSETHSLPPALSFGEHNKKRFTKMAWFRNKYLQEIRQPKYQDFDYVAVLDLDIVGGIHTEGFISTFASDHKWDMVGANGINYKSISQEYYDPLAFRDDHMRRIRHHCVDDCDRFSLAQQPIINPQKSEWIPITSGFAGLAIYRKVVLMQCDYHGYDCEHITLHDCMLNKGFHHLYINPRMLLVR
jgi:hypothetical protein